MARWIDVSVRLRNGLVPWPGDPAFELKRVNDMARGDSAPARAILRASKAASD
jgi:arylformamidase